MNRQIRILLGRLLLLGAYSGFFWGIIYPELCLTEDICVVAEGENIDPGQLPEELEQAIREGRVEIRFSLLETWKEWLEQ
jgi:hypothetical protein